MIHPLIPYALRGVLWYQGECNAISGAEGYQELLENLIDDWRGHWGQRRLDFLIIQLPGYQRRRTVSIHSQWGASARGAVSCGVFQRRGSDREL